MAEKDDAYNLLVDKCIESFSKLLNTSLALDINHIQGNMRSIILHDERFISETKAIKAQQYLDELNQVEDIYKAATKMGGAIDEAASSIDDGRDGSDGMSDKQVLQAKKDALQMQLKASEMRRELKSLNAENTEGEEESAVNFFFTALTREEMLRIKQVEVNFGTEDEKEALKEMDKEESDDIASKTLRRKAEAKAMHGEAEDEPEETVKEDGTIVMED